MKTNVTRKPRAEGSTFSLWFRSIDPQIVGLVMALLALVAFFGLRIPQEFFRPVNLVSITEGITLIGLTALAETVVMILGGLDISIGSLLGLCSAAAGVAMARVSSPVVGVATALLVGSLGGLLNGAIITRGKLDPVVVTLATYTAYRGVALLTTPGGYAVNVRNLAFNSLGTADILGIPLTVVILLVAIAFFIFLLSYTTIGRNIFAIGGNPVEARLAGIDIDWYKVGVYTLAGLMAGLAAIILTARTKSGQPISGSEGMELQAITAAILGGVSSKGGKGTVVGAMLGVLIIGTLNNGMILLSIPTFYQRVARGLLLVVAALIQNWQLRSAKAAAVRRARIGTQAA
jgi:ribose/xylose/arabinose/galactoside ABC-type transport system permease subunit